MTLLFYSVALNTFLVDEIRSFGHQLLLISCHQNKLIELSESISPQQIVETQDVVHLVQTKMSMIPIKNTFFCNCECECVTSTTAHLNVVALICARLKKLKLPIPR